MLYFVRGEDSRDCWEVDHKFISQEYISIEETKSKAIRAYAQSRQYHIITKVRDF